MSDSTRPQLRRALTQGWARAGIELTLTGVGTIVTVIVVILMLGASGTRPTMTRDPRTPRTVAYFRRTYQLQAADRTVVQNAVRLRAMALSPGRTALYRAFAAGMALRGLITLHPVLPGPCAVAISYLYDNLLDLHNAYPKEDWRPLRRFTKKQPSLNPCAPKTTRRTAYVS